MKAAKADIAAGMDVYIVTARQESQSTSVYEAADELGIPHDHVHFTNGKDKWPEVKKLGLKEFHDNNPDQVKMINDKTNTRAYVFGDEKSRFCARQCLCAGRRKGLQSNL